jgi:hypothetical protein
MDILKNIKYKNKGVKSKTYIITDCNSIGILNILDMNPKKNIIIQAAQK